MSKMNILELLYILIYGFMEKFVDKYIEENRNFITASKLKCFIKSPEDFFLKYIKEVPPLQEKEKKHFIIGTALDDLISYGETKFHQKYFLDKGLNISEMKDRLIQIGTDEEALKGLKKPDFENLLYGDTSGKIRLTPGDAEVIFGCYNELCRQPLFNKNGKFEAQKTFTCEYKTLKLKGTLDRYKSDEIRDTKTCKSITSFMWDWKDKLGYDVSMAFYWVLAWKATGNKDIKVTLDVVQKTFPYPSRIFEIPSTTIIDTGADIIIGALDTLNAVMIAWEKTGDEKLWKVKQKDFNKLASCDMYPIMESALQDEIESLQ